MTPKRFFYSEFDPQINIRKFVETGKMFTVYLLNRIPFNYFLTSFDPKTPTIITPNFE